MHSEIAILAVTAASIGFLHTLFGPDHYLPFIVMSRAKQWSRRKTLIITFFCGVGHVLSSVVLGLVGVALGIAVFRLEAVESFRAGIATWAFIAFGFTYMVWGIHKALRGKVHAHVHLHGNGSSHDHSHSHIRAHAHPHQQGKANVTPWILFTIFVFGPCEPLIPILMYPAAHHSISSMAFVSCIFGGVTIATMMGLVIAGCFGISFLPLRKLERYSHAIAGAALSSCGLAMLFGL